MTTIVVSRFTWLERWYARCLRAASRSRLAEQATEEQLRAYPATFWCRSQEANVAVLERLRQNKDWIARLSRFAAGERLSRPRLNRLIAQVFVMTWGRQLASVRLCAASLEGPVSVVTDLPLALIDALLPEFGGRVVHSPLRSLPLRCVLAAHSATRLLARHVLRMWRLVGLQRLPPRSTADLPDYIAWLGALPGEVQTPGPERLNLAELLDEARAGSSLQVLIQGATPTALPAGFVHRKHLPSVRFRPDWSLTLRAVADQFRCMVRDLARIFDFRHTTLAAAATFDIPSFRLWFRADAPLAILYANHQIGGEPPVALLEGPVPSTMVFYSANVAYRPVNVNAPGTPLEPEMRYIIADCLTMWSPEMTGGFRTAGYEPGRLVETGPIFFGRQNTFRPTSRFMDARSKGPTRLGIFDVAVLRPSSRFAGGFGLLTYNADLTRRFFADIFSAAGQRFGEDVVVVRKKKRGYHPSFDEDIDFGGLPPIRIEPHDSTESLWRLLEQVDLVLCMPFTSVAYLADECGIPAAYYDPGGECDPSPLGGRVPLLSGFNQLHAWLGAPGVPAARVPSRVAPRILAAATGTLAAAGAPHTFWESVEECRSH